MGSSPNIVQHWSQNCPPPAACCRHLHTGRGWAGPRLTNELEKFANSCAGTALLTRRPGGGCQISPYPPLSSEQLVHTNKIQHFQLGGSFCCFLKQQTSKCKATALSLNEIVREETKKLDLDIQSLTPFWSHYFKVESRYTWLDTLIVLKKKRKTVHFPLLSFTIGFATGGRSVAADNW